MRIILILQSAIFFSMNIMAQNNSADSADRKAERMYVHFDKPFYSSGETIWFKAYLYFNGMPSINSNNLYMAIADLNGNIIDQKKYPVKAATATGNFDLPDSLRQGYYTIRAITPGMENSGVSYSHRIFIYNSSLRTVSAINKQKNISVQFFPESGNLIDRVRTQVAFKAIDETGMPVDIEGMIKSADGSVQVPFKSYHDGMGRLSLTPHKADELFAEIKSGGIMYKFPLSVVQASGIGLKITDENDSRLYEITRSKTDKEKFDSIKLVVKLNNETVFENDISFDFDFTLKGHLKTTDLPAGILHFIVLNKNGIPLAERLSFVNNSYYSGQPELLVIKRSNGKRGINHFEIKFNDTIQRSCSVAITDIAAQDFPDKENIYSGLLLTPDIRGYVFNPAYYFQNENDSTKLALDNIMLTHGWIRYSSEKISTKKYSDQQLLSISGIIDDQKKQQPVSGGTVLFQLVAQDSSVQSFETPVDKQGKFRLDSLLFFGDVQVFYTYTNADGKITPVTLHPDEQADNISKLLFTANTNLPGNNIPDAIAVPMEYDLGKFRQLPTVVLHQQFIRPSDKLNEKYASLMFRTSGKLVLDNINNPHKDNSQNVLSYILQNVRTVELDNKAGTLVNSKNFSLQNGAKWKVELLIDESVSTVSNVKTLSLENVAMIKFYEAGFLGVGSGSPGGAIAVYLKRDQDADIPLLTDAGKFFKYKGYTVTKEFYQPEYKTQQSGDIYPDNRITLYWKPEVYTNASSNIIKIDFYNNDFSKKINLIMEGFDSNGRLLHFEKIIE